MVKRLTKATRTPMHNKRLCPMMFTTKFAHSLKIPIEDSKIIKRIDAIATSTWCT